MSQNFVFLEFESPLFLIFIIQAQNARPTVHAFAPYIG